MKLRHLFSFHRVYLILVVILLSLFSQNSKAQSAAIRSDLLQGHWWFRSLQTIVNFDMYAETETFFPWNIHFIIHQDTCMMITLNEKNTYTYDSTEYLLKIDGDLLEFSPIKHKKKGPNLLPRLQIVSINNQSLTLQDIEGADVHQSLFLRNATFIYVFSGHQDLYQLENNPQRELTGIWYSSSLFDKQLETHDTILLSAIPIPFVEKIDSFEDTWYHLVIITDEHIESKDSLVSVNKAFLPPSYAFPPSLFYYIVPDKKQLEITINQQTLQSNRYGMPIYTIRSFLFTYYRKDNTLVLIKQHP